MANIAERVDAIMKLCLNEKPEGALVVEGLERTFGFSSEKVAVHREEIRELLDHMDPSFHTNGGGGMTFLNLPRDKHLDQWGEQRDAEALLCLGIAAGMAKILVPRELWSMFPGGVPYVCFDTTVPA